MTVGIIGAGFMGRMHARIYKKMEHVDLRGVAARTKKRSGAVAKELRIQCYKDYTELLADAEIDVVDICAPTAIHAEIALKALGAGKHIIIEFPVCKNAKELYAVYNKSRQSDLICAVAYYTRFQSQYKHIFDYAVSGKLGKINGLSITRKSQHYFSSDDIVNNLVSQDIDYMVRLLGKPFAVDYKAVGKDQVLFVFRYQGFHVTIEGRTDMHPGFPFTTGHFISGTRASIDLSWQFTDRPSYNMILNGEEKVQNITCDDYDPYEYELRYITDKISKNQSDDMFSIESVLESSVLTYACKGPR